MRPVLPLVVLVLLAGQALAEETYVVLADWRSGTFTAGTPAEVEVEGVNALTIPFEATECPRTLLLDLLLDPDETGAAVPGVGEAAVKHAVRAQVWRNGTLLSDVDVRRSGYGIPVGATHEPGPHELRLLLTLGAHVEYDARLRGRLLSPSPCDEVVLGA